MFKYFQRIILGHFFSLTCPLCKNTIIKFSDTFCDVCFEKLDLIDEHIICNNCGGQNDTILDQCSKCLREEISLWDDAISIMNMSGLSRDAIIKFKYYSEISIAKPLAKLCTEKIITSGIKPDIITNIPLYWSKYLYRGFNQSSIIAKLVSKNLGIKYTKTLKRIKNTKSQTKLKGSKRRKNLIGAFKLCNIKLLKNKNILLIDDVYTTGTTLREAAALIKSTNINKLYILTLARR